MKHTPEEVAELVVGGVLWLNREHPGWFREVSDEPWKGEPAWLPVLLPPVDVQAEEIAWHTAVRLLRAMDKETRQ